MQRYLDQVALSLRPSSVVAANGILREFAGYLTTEFPEIGGLSDVERHHVEGFKRHLGTRLSRNDTGRTLTPQRIRIVLGTLRTFFERVSEWDYPDAPTRVLIFNGDLPTPDDPLPKFLSDPDAAKLMHAAAETDPVRRLVVEMLARTGLRVGEFCESCAYFSTNQSFVPVLETQRDHAADRDQHHRVDLFNMLLDRTRTEQP